MVAVPDGDQPKYAVASTWMQLAGKPRGRVDQHGLSQQGLVVWKIHRPLRVVSRVSGVQLNGDVYANDTARVDQFRCGAGVFRVTLLPKQAGQADVMLDGKLVRHVQLAGRTPVQVSVPARGDSCQLAVHTNALVGTSQLQFDRS